MGYEFYYGSEQIAFDLEYVDRKTVGIVVAPDTKIRVKAPTETSIEKVLEAVKRKAAWILKQQSFFLSFHPKSSPRRYLSGESHLYLGRQYRLKLAEGSKDVVVLTGKYLIVTYTKQKKVPLSLKKWYLNKAESKFLEYARPLIDRFKKYDVEPTEIILREMATRWGSCTEQGKIILNPELIKAPKGCIEYVIIHELCHLVHHNHTSKFLQLQSKEMPDWEKWKQKLENVLA